MKRKITSISLSIACAFVLFFGFTSASNSMKLTVKTIYSKELRTALSTPSFFWTNKDKLLLYDYRIAPNERTIEILDPKTLKITPACSAQKAIESLKLLLTKHAANFLPWPICFSHDGQKGAYLFNGDIYVLDLKKSSFSQVTKTPLEEKCISFSPNDQKISFVRANNLYVYDFITKKTVQLTFDGSENILNGTLSWVYWEEIFGRRDEAYWWSPDSESIAFFQSDQTMVDEYILSDFEPAVPNTRIQRYPKAGDKNPTVRVGVVSASGGKIRWVRFNNPSIEYLLRVKWLPRGDRFSILTMTRNQKEVELYFSSRDCSKIQKVLVEKSNYPIETQNDLHFLKNGKEFIWASERDGYNHLYLYDSDGKILKSLNHGEWMVMASSGYSWVSGGVCAIDESNGTIFFTANMGTPIAPELFSVCLDEGHTHKISTESGTHVVAFSPSSKYYVDRFSNASTPPGLYLYDSSGKLIKTLCKPAIGVAKKYNLTYPKFFTITSNDGVQLPAQMLKPKDFDPSKKYPVIIYVYGGPASPVVRNSWQRDIFFDNILAKNGFICVSVDNRTASGLSAILTNSAYGKLLSGTEVPDLLAAVNWLKKQPFVDPNRIGVWGWSGGGSFTLQLMTHTKAFKAGIAVAAVSDFRYYDTKWTEHMLGTPQENPKGYHDGSPAYFAGKLHGHLMIVHGSGDDNVHPQNMMRFVYELEKKDIPFDLMIYPLEKHGIYHSWARIHLFNTMLNFWKKNL